jgi:hypothetical protein
MEANHVNCIDLRVSSLRQCRYDPAAVFDLAVVGRATASNSKAKYMYVPTNLSYTNFRQKSWIYGHHLRIHAASRLPSLQMRGG